jgi:DNA-binding XRE family transcriptional regulator
MPSWKPRDIISLREKHNLTQKALGELVGVTTNYIYLLEKGDKKPSKTLQLLLDCVNDRLVKSKKERR